MFFYILTHYYFSSKIKHIKLYSVNRSFVILKIAFRQMPHNFNLFGDFYSILIFISIYNNREFYFLIAVFAGCKIAVECFKMGK